MHSVVYSCCVAIPYQRRKMTCSHSCHYSTDRCLKLLPPQSVAPPVLLPLHCLANSASRHTRLPYMQLSTHRDHLQYNSSLVLFCRRICCRAAEHCHTASACAAVTHSTPLLDPPASQTYTLRSALPAVTRLPSGDQSQRSKLCSKLCWWPCSTFSHLQQRAAVQQQPEQCAVWHHTVQASAAKIRQVLINANHAMHRTGATRCAQHITRRHVHVHAIVL